MLFWRRISGTSEPTASQSLRRINLSFAASLKSAGKSAARRFKDQRGSGLRKEIVGAALRRPPCLPIAMRRGTAYCGGAPLSETPHPSLLPDAAAACNQNPWERADARNVRRSEVTGFACRPPKRIVPRFPITPPALRATVRGLTNARAQCWCIGAHRARPGPFSLETVHRTVSRALEPP